MHRYQVIQTKSVVLSTDNLTEARAMLDDHPERTIKYTDAGMATYSDTHSPHIGEREFKKKRRS